MIALNLKYWNKILRHKSPEEIVEWAQKLSKSRLVTTSFGKYSSAILNLMSKMDQDIKVIWCDTNYNSPETYEYAQGLIHRLKLNINIYKPLLDQTSIEATFGVPTLDNPNYSAFKEVVKLEPFRRALREHQPEAWFTNIRIGQTKNRNSKDILSYSKEGILKISPFYYWTDTDLDHYLNSNDLPKNESYYDVTKMMPHLECGIHLQ